jgi:rRNA processing protein Krr1/Pno1
MNGVGPAADAAQVDISSGDLPPDAPDASGQFVGYVACPESLVSKLIGKKGAVIQTLETLTGAKIQVEHQKVGDPKHVRIVAKSQEDLDKTKSTIKETLEAEHPLGEVTKVISCPHEMVGRIIGRAGQTILSLQQASQAKIVVDQDPERFPDGAPRDVRLIGMAHCVDRAEKMVVELMNAEPGVSAQSVIQKVSLHLLLPTLTPTVAGSTFHAVLTNERSIHCVCSMGWAQLRGWNAQGIWLAA